MTRLDFERNQKKIKDNKKNNNAVVEFIFT